MQPSIHISSFHYNWKILQCLYSVTVHILPMDPFIYYLFLYAYNPLPKRYFLLLLMTYYHKMLKDFPQDLEDTICKQKGDLGWTVTMAGIQWGCKDEEEKVQAPSTWHQASPTWGFHPSGLAPEQGCTSGHSVRDHPPCHTFLTGPHLQVS